MIIRHAIICRTLIRKNVDPFEFYFLARLYSNEYDKVDRCAVPMRANIAYETGKKQRWVTDQIKKLLKKGFVERAEKQGGAPRLTISGLERFLYLIADMHFMGADITAVQASLRYERHLKRKYADKVKEWIRRGVITPGVLKRDLVTQRFNLPPLLDSHIQ